MKNNADEAVKPPHETRPSMGLRLAEGVRPSLLAAGAAGKNPAHPALLQPQRRPSDA